MFNVLYSVVCNHDVQVNENGRANEESMMPFEEKGIEDAEERKRNHSVHSQSSQDPPLVLPAAGIDSQQLRNSSILPHQSQACKMKLYSVWLACAWLYFYS